VVKSGKKLLILSTGGTIAQVFGEGKIATIGDEPPNEFKGYLTQLGERLGVEIDEESVIDKDSSNITPDDWVKLIDAVYEKYDVYDAFLITHGTNTLGYTCAALSFAFENINKPVVLTGSQVPIGEPGSDALMNLENAIQVATTTEYPLAGVVAVFGSHIIAGTRVNKTTEFEYDGFRSYNTGALGRVGRVVKIYKDPLDAHLKQLEPKARGKSSLEISKNFNMNIVTLTEFPGMTSDFLHSLAKDLKVGGVIFRAAGAGDPNIARPETWKNTDETFDLAKGFKALRDMNIPVVITTQASDGIASMDINEPGPLALDCGVIPAWDMSLEALTVKLGWLMGKGMRYGEICRQMIQNVKGEISIVRT